MSKAFIASMGEMLSPLFSSFLSELELFAGQIGLEPQIRYCRRWEYPWLWFNCLIDCHYPLLDIGSGLSPMPWYLSHYGKVTMTEIDPAFIPKWETMGPGPDWALVKDEALPFADNSFATVTSFSVIEHQNNKELALAEILRVLKPGGQLAMSFDLVEPALGMHYSRSDIPLSMESFEQLFWFHPAFGNRLKPDWNLEDIPAFLAWHRTTAPPHTYVAAGTVLTRDRSTLL